MRDGLRGTWHNDDEGAFLAGIAGHEESVKFGLVGAVKHHGVNMSKVNNSRKPWALEPSQMISYVSCHDDMCIADRIKATIPGCDVAERMRLQKMAYTAVLTSRGVPLIWCGDEIMRDRKGIHNCYSQPDSVNAIPWNLKTEHKSVFDYICKLILLRKELCFQCRNIEFLPVEKANIITTVYNNDVIVIMNSNRKSITQRLPNGEWVLRLASVRMSGTRFQNAVKVPAQTAVIMIKIEK